MLNNQIDFNDKISTFADKSDNKLENLRTKIFTTGLNEMTFQMEKYFEMFDQHLPGLRNDFSDLNHSMKKLLGCDNYANDILSDIKGLNNESHAWKSGLDSDQTIIKVIKNLKTSNNAASKVSFKINEETRNKILSNKFQPIKIIKIDIDKSKDDFFMTKTPKETSNRNFSFKSIPGRSSPTTSGTLSFGLSEKTKPNLIETSNKYSNRNLVTDFNTESQNSPSNRFVKDNSPLGIPLFIKNPTYNRNKPETSQNEVARENNECSFRTAKEQLVLDNYKKNSNNSPQLSSLYGNSKKSLGTRKGVWSDFVTPVAGNKNEQNNKINSPSSNTNFPTSNVSENNKYKSIISHENLKQFEPGMIESLLNEIMDSGKQINWNDIAGLESVKSVIQEIVILPILRPDLFSGIRKPPKGLLLFGPPGTGKTLIAKCIASQTESAFFSISASSLTSKWVGEGEKMVRVMFTVARLLQPAVIFIDEIDSLLSQRNETEHESSRRIKTEFLIQMDGAGTDENEKLLLIGATNRPYEIDEAARRRFVRRLYIPLPSREARKQIIENSLNDTSFYIASEQLNLIVDKSDGYSAADMSNLCKEAAMGPLRRFPLDQIKTISSKDIPPITFKDFEVALENVKSSVSSNDLDKYLKWNDIYGSSLKK